ncbi:MAG: hypothetical protein ACI4D8_04520 [Wujia sp.]
MKLKYFLRGLGLGIIFGALIMLAAYMTSGKYKISDEEVIERAGKLGMIMREDPITNNNANADKATTQSDKETDSDADENKTEDDQTGNTAELTTGTTEDTNPVTTEETPDTTDTSETTGDNTSEEISINPDNEYITAQITVTSGMSSTKVARLLQDTGIIEDYLDFDSYLNSNGYSTKIRINTYEFNSNMTYEEIAKELTDENYGQ